MKLFGYEFDIIYNPGAYNGPVDALSRILVAPNSFHLIVSISQQPPTTIWSTLCQFNHEHPTSIVVLNSV